MENGLLDRTSPPSFIGPKALYTGFSFTQSDSGNEWRLLPCQALPSPLGAIRVQFVEMPTSDSDGKGFEPPTFGLMDKAFYLLSEVPTVYIF